MAGTEVVVSFGLLTQGGYGDNEDALAITILAPREIRDRELTRKMEKLTRKRILDYFRDEHRKVLLKRRRRIASGMAFVVSGLACFFMIRIIAGLKK